MAEGSNIFYSGDSSYTDSNPGPIRGFLDKVSKSWDLSFVWPKIWALRFEPREHTAGKAIADTEPYNLLKNIYDILYNKYDDLNRYTLVHDYSNWIGYNGQQKKDDNDYAEATYTPYFNLLTAGDTDGTHVSVGGIPHFLLANKLTYQEEKMNLANASVMQQLNLGGILEGRAGGNRSLSAEARQLSVTFINTNYDFVEHVIRPWIVAASYRGFIETSQLPELKCNIHTFYFAKSSPNYYTYETTMPGSNLVACESNENQPYLYQEIIFHDCVPIWTPSKGFNYSADLGTDETMTEVKFSYEFFTVKYHSMNHAADKTAIVDNPVEESENAANKPVKMPGWQTAEGDSVRHSYYSRV